ncbi:MAG: cysteine hydrolase family protein [Desulfobacterales bacterium]
MKSGLILIDIQKDYFPGGKMELVGMEKAANNAGKLLDKFRKAKLPVFHVQHISKRKGAAFFLPGTEGVKLHESVEPLPHEIVVQKNFPNSFRDTPLLNHLNGANIEKVVICGAMSHMCVDATTRAAFDLGFNCVVIEDACATRNLQHKGIVVEAENVHAAFMAALAVLYAKVISLNDFNFTDFENTWR